MQYTRYFFSLVMLGLGLSIFSGCESDSTDDGGSGNNGDSEPAAMNGITAAHNRVRANVNPPAATPLPALTWSPEIAAVAQAYAEKCIWGHSGGAYGENLFASTGGTSPQEVVDSWASESKDYDYASNGCSGVCGHYTQIVWADSLRLGCGKATCADNAPWGSGAWEIWVCNYDPAGNWSGEKPY
ncbi:MAG TPA: CAP domain-containing protein [Polyangium sp.]|nr:CAP domain-containing protein [Polyangium sp.]